MQLTSAELHALTAQLSRTTVSRLVKDAFYAAVRLRDIPSHRKAEQQLCGVYDWHPDEASVAVWATGKLQIINSKLWTDVRNSIERKGAQSFTEKHITVVASAYLSKKGGTEDCTAVMAVLWDELHRRSAWRHPDVRVLGPLMKHTPHSRQVMSFMKYSWRYHPDTLLQVLEEAYDKRHPSYEQLQYAVQDGLRTTGLRALRVYDTFINVVKGNRKFVDMLAEEYCARYRTAQKKGAEAREDLHHLYLALLMVVNNAANDVSTALLVDNMPEGLSPWARSMTIRQLGRLGSINQSFFEYHVMPFTRMKGTSLTDLVTAACGVPNMLSYISFWDHVGAACMREGLKNDRTGRTIESLVKFIKQLPGTCMYLLEEEVAARGLSCFTAKQLVSLKEGLDTDIFPHIHGMVKTKEARLSECVALLNLPDIEDEVALLHDLREAIEARPVKVLAQLPVTKITLLITRMADLRWAEGQLVDNVKIITQRARIPDEEWAQIHADFARMNVSI
eukprot:TRINITY_DN21528_c0_g1_i1.p1 TRINITY_DN21528_c0_g1~~TRINITY_DN21528_c0_g1_i1.p1  ORF type:complete len:505 (+),score=148.40 TRINITY_DN21528_c0_g1_i1:310-1824(+)